ncbi:MAG TPA: glycosyltransferase family 4 protein [Patescibacteria group bacterium]|nr:glycosyltransferase family 4 protein [Patescibacteria group bacterium]
MNITYFDLDDVANPLLGAGQARATYEVASRLAARGHNVTVVASNYPGARDRVEAGIHYTHIGPATGNIKVNNFAYFAAVPWYAKSLTRQKADVVLECFTAPTSTLMSPLFTKVPVVAIPSMFNAKEFSKKYHLPFEIIEKFGVAHYRYALPYSDVDSAKLKKLNPNITYEIIGQGVGDEYTNLKLTTPKHILFLSRLDMDQKGIDLLLEAYAKIANSVTYPLVIAGHGPDEKKIAQYIHALHLEKSVTMVGGAYGEKKFKLMAEAVCVAFPSRHDEMCLWTLEGLAAGLPFVVFDLPESRWMPETVSLKAPMYDVASFATLLKKAADPKVRDTMGKAARKFTRQFNWENVVNRYEKFLTMVVDRERKN